MCYCTKSLLRGEVCTDKLPANFQGSHQDLPNHGQVSQGRAQVDDGSKCSRVGSWAWFGISWVLNSPVEHMVICTETLRKLASRSEPLDLTFAALCSNYLFRFLLMLSTLHIKFWQIFSLHCMHEQSTDCQYVISWSINILLQLLYYSWEKYCTYYHIFDHC